MYSYLQAVAGLTSVSQGQTVARIQAEPETIKDDGLGERDVYKDLKLPSHIDSMMHEHSKFLTEYGEPYSMRLRLSPTEALLLARGKSLLHL